MKKKGLRSKLIRIFILTSTIPLVLMGLLMTYSTITALRRNTQNFTLTNLKRVDDNLRITLDAYEDLLYQIYTNDDVVTWVDRLNADDDVPVATNQLRRYLQGLLNTKDYIRSLTIITDSGMVITYDQMTPATYKNSWTDSFSLTPEELYARISADNKTHVFPTEYGTRFANKDYYLFHLSHRIIDYRNLDKRSGVVILSLDEKLLEQILVDDTSNEFYFMVDRDGRLIASPAENQIGTVLFSGPDEEAPANTQAEQEKRTAIYEEFAKTISSSHAAVYVHHDELLGWDIVNVKDQGEFFQTLMNRIRIIGVGCVILFLITLMLLKKLSGEIMESVNKIVQGMKDAEEGNLSVQIPVEEKTPLELEIVTRQVNDTFQKLEEALCKEKEAIDRQRVSEIRALEAQINPHFLYNTLDTINWMAIDQEEYDISNAINALARILRYAITDYDAVVPIREEIEWLKKYVYLQQFRLKNRFVCRIDADPELMEVRMHKLILQPFVENAIIHGFQKNQEQCVLEVEMRKDGDELRILIRDNGKGMPSEIVDRINRGKSIGEHIEGDDRRHIGLDNALVRLRMYCRGKQRIEVSSEKDQGTQIVIYVPIDKGE